MNIYERIKQLRLAQGMSQYDLAQKVGYEGRSAISKVENGERDISQSMIEKYATALGVTPTYLLYGEEAKEAPTKNNKIPVFGMVAAGIPISAIEDIIDYEEIDEQTANSGEYFALKIKGDSMEPRMTSGDVVIVRSQSTIESGDIAIVLINGEEATCKKIKQTPEGIMLISLNPAYEPMFYSKKQIKELPVRILGKVVELRAKFN